MEDSIFAESVDFALDSYVTGAAATDIGFQKTKIFLKIVPAFQTVLLKFKFTLEMPKQYWDTNNYMFNFATVSESNGAIPTVTIGCAMQNGNPESAEVYEYNASFDKTADLNLPFWEQNFANKEEFPNFFTVPKIEEYMPYEDSSGKISQSCLAEIEIPPDEAAVFFGKTF